MPIVERFVLTAETDEDSPADASDADAEPHTAETGSQEIATIAEQLAQDVLAASQKGLDQDSNASRSFADRVDQAMANWWEPFRAQSSRDELLKTIRHFRGLLPQP